MLRTAFGQTGHFGDTAGVVGDRAVGVKRHDDAGHGQHRGCGDRDAVQAAQCVGAIDCQTHGQHRRCGGLHRHAQAGDHVGAVTGGGCLRNVAHRAELGRGVVLGDPHHRGGQRQTDQGGQIQIHRRYQLAADHHAITQQPGGYRVERDHRQHGRTPARPRYSAFMILPPSRALTKKVPMMEAMIETPPSTSG